MNYFDDYRSRHSEIYKKLEELSEEASEFMNFGEHSYQELCETEIWKKAKDLLLEYWRDYFAEMWTDSLYLKNTTSMYYCENCDQIHSDKFITIHHYEYDWNFIFDPDLDKICIECISCHRKGHKEGYWGYI